MVDFSRMTDPGENVQFRRDWGAGRFQVRLSAEAARWLEARRKKRTRARASTALSRHARMRSWRAST